MSEAKVVALRAIGKGIKHSELRLCLKMRNPFYKSFGIFIDTIAELLAEGYITKQEVQTATRSYTYYTPTDKGFKAAKTRIYKEGSDLQADYADFKILGYLAAEEGSMKRSRMLIKARCLAVISSASGLDKAIRRLIKKGFIYTDVIQPEKGGKFTLITLTGSGEAWLKEH